MTLATLVGKGVIEGENILRKILGDWFVNRNGNVVPLQQLINRKVSTRPNYEKRGLNRKRSRIHAEAVEKRKKSPLKASREQQNDLLTFKKSR